MFDRDKGRVLRIVVKSQRGPCSSCVHDLTVEILTIVQFRAFVVREKIGAWQVGQPMRDQGLSLKAVVELEEPPINEHDVEVVLLSAHAVEVRVLY
jgi:hypothetical protein